MARRGLQTELLVSFSLVMLTASVMLGLLLERAHRAELLPLRQLAARALALDARLPEPVGAAATPGLRWWSVGPDGVARRRGEHAAEPAPELIALAREARARGESLLESGLPWEPLRFAAPAGANGRVAAAELPPSASRLLVLVLLAADVLVFTAFGAWLLRRRVVRPLERLAEAARAFGAGEPGVRVPAEGMRETFELARTFNDMTEALERRTHALGKAVTELRESNRRLREMRAGLDRAERLAAVGRLAAGVAHEVGNPMGALLAFLDLAGRPQELPAASREALARAAREGERVRAILRQLLDFSRPSRAERRPVCLVRVCRETAELVRAQRRYAGIAIDVEERGAPPEALGDPGAVAQILLNLLLNAADALAPVAAPRIRIGIAAAARASRSGDADEGSPARRRADAVVCRVADNGPGIPEEDRERVFDPFFTTKAPGEGTGLGLANAARLAEEMGGSLELEVSRAGEGAVFALRLPAAGGGPSAQVRSD